LRILNSIPPLTRFPRELEFLPRAGGANALSFLPRIPAIPLSSRILRGLAVAFCLAFVLRVPAQATPAERPLRYAVTSYGVEDGLPDPVVTAIVQTHDGYLWVGTDHGLARFDGVEFTVYRAANTPGFPHDMVRALFEDAAGTLWIGTQSGLSSYKDGTFVRVTGVDTPVTAILVDHAQRLWVGTRGQGLFEYVGGKLRSSNTPGRESGRLFVRTLFEDSAGRVWAGLGAGPPAYIQDDHLKRLDIAPPIAGPTQFAEQPRGTLWFTSGASVVRWRDGTVVRYGKDEGLGDEDITGIHADPSGQIWTVARRHLRRLNQADSSTFTAVSVPALNQARHMISDREGNYWLATSGFGLAKMRASAFENIALPADDPQVASTISVDQSGTISLGLTPDGVVRLAPDGTQLRIDTGGMPANELLSTCSTRDGRLWIGRRSTLLIWHDGTRVEYPEARGVRAIYEDGEGVVWLGSESAGILRFQNGQFENMSAKLGLRAGTAATVFTEHQGALYIGLLMGGLLEVRGSAVTHYNVTTGAPLEMIRSMKSDSEGYLWIGMRGNGLALFHDGHVWNPPTLSDPFQGMVSAVEFDEAGNVFIGSSRGILWAPRAAVLAVARGERSDNPFQRAGESDGLKPAIVGFGPLPTSGKSLDGRLWFATRTGVIAVDPSQLAANPVAPPVHILQASIAERRGEIVNRTLVIPPDGAAIRIDYTAPYFARPDLVHFRYRLENYDTAWTDAGTRRSALYSHLPPGKHLFRVIAANESDVWNREGATLTIVQQPHFYQTLWFRVLVVSAFTALIVVAVRWWTHRNLQRHLDALEAERRLQRERTRIARDLHDEIGGSVTKIGYLVDRLETGSSDPFARQVQQQLSRQTRLLASDLDRVVWSVSPTNGTLARLANFIATFAQTFLRETPVRCSTRVPPGLPQAAVTPEFQHHVLAVTKEAINNALKHAKPTLITLQMSFDGNVFTVEITDNGCGFEVDHHAHSERNGLANMRARVGEIGGELTITSLAGRGTTVRLCVPLTPSPAPNLSSPVASPPPSVI
jgi:signal transduction histidine kinase/ligand-binding sensor domain-containing protein